MGRDDDSWSSGYYGGGGGNPYSEAAAAGRAARQHHDSTMVSIRAMENRQSGTSMGSSVPSEPISITHLVYVLLCLALCWQVCLALSTMTQSLWIVFGVPLVLLLLLMRVTRLRRFKRYARVMLVAATAGFFFVPSVQEAMLPTVLWLNPFD